MFLDQTHLLCGQPKKLEKAYRKGAGVNFYGQPDCKISIVLDNFPFNFTFTFTGKKNKRRWTQEDVLRNMMYIYLTLLVSKNYLTINKLVEITKIGFRLK